MRITIEAPAERRFRRIWRVGEMIALYRNWPLALLDRFCLIRRGKRLSLRLSVNGRLLYLIAESGAEDVRVINEMFLQRPYTRMPEIRKEAGFRPVWVDIGANRGYFAVFAAALHESIALYCFEPEPVNFSILSENLAANNVEDVELNRFAVTVRQTSTPAVLFRSSLPGRHSLIGSRVSEASPLDTPEAIEVPAVDICSALSSILDAEPAIDLLKIDTEGTEADLIAAISSEHLKRIESISAEVGDTIGPGSVQHLTRAGFTVRHDAPFLWAWRDLQTDRRTISG